MKVTLQPGALSGAVTIPASKSQAHRLLICAALGQSPVTLRCDGISQDIAATVRCLQALGAAIREEAGQLHITPIKERPQGCCELLCGESGSTLRFLLPVAGALGAEGVFHMEGRLSARPMEVFEAELTRHGMVLCHEGDTLRFCGALHGGDFTLPGNISSQYISGLLLALPRLAENSTLTVTGRTESAAYIAMTEDALAQSGIRIDKENRSYRIPGGQRFCLPQKLQVEGDYSNAAFFLCAGALSPAGVTVRGLNKASAQGDRAVKDLLRQFGAAVTESDDKITVTHAPLHGIPIDAAGIPDLVPVLAVVAACAEGITEIKNAGRLRLKESDRLTAVSAVLTALGATVTEEAEGLLITGGAKLLGGEVSACNDHRIAMMAAVAACACAGPVTVEGAECVAKSYPRFWQDYEMLKGATT